MYNPFRKTVDGVIAGFQKTAADLRQIVAERGAEVSAINDQINVLTVERGAAVREAVRAEQIASKLEALIS